MIKDLAVVGIIWVEDHEVLEVGYCMVQCILTAGLTKVHNANDL